MSTIIDGSERKSKEKPLFTKENPFLSYLRERAPLSKEGSSKKTFHLSLKINNPSFLYKEGDAIGVLPKNPDSLVSAILSLLNTAGDVVIKNPRSLNPESPEQLSFKDYLYYKTNLTRVTPALLHLINNTLSSHPDLEKLLLPENKLLRSDYTEKHDLLSCLEYFSPKNLDLQELVNATSPILPRFYSIASSSSHYPEEIHLLVSTFSYTVQEKPRTGVGSQFLCYEADFSTPIPIYVQHNPNFCLPSDLTTPMIMIGAGTGIAPYRAFLQQRSHALSSSIQKPRFWLFFGERNQAFDFYYEQELTRYVNQGLLKLSAAFSRDQQHKIYIQHLMEEQSKELWQWIQEGANIYLCGDAKQMAKDVNNTLLSIFQKEGSLSLEESKELLHLMRKQKRFQVDVY
jgi:sulfite reductase (NADPH) flavoprotein alpha-component